MDTDEDTVLTGTGNNGKLYSISRSDKTGWTVVDCTNVRELLSKPSGAEYLCADSGRSGDCGAPFFQIYGKKYYTSNSETA